MKFLKLILIIAILALPAIALAQTDSMVIDTTVVTPSPFDFDKLVTPEAMARLFGVEPVPFLIFIGMIFGLTEFFKRNVKRGGELFFVDNRSIPLPFVVGVFLALIVPLDFGFIATIRFGLQGAVAATLVYMFGSWTFGGAPRR